MWNGCKCFGRSFFFEPTTSQRKGWDNSETKRWQNFFFDAIRILESREIAAGDKKRPARFFPRCTHPKTPIPIIHPRESFWKKKKVIEVSYRYIESEFLSKFHHCYMFLWLIPSKCTLCYKKTHRFVLANQSRALDFHVAGHTAVDNGSLWKENEKGIFFGNTQEIGRAPKMRQNCNWKKRRKEYLLQSSVSPERSRCIIKRWTHNQRTNQTFYYIFFNILCQFKCCIIIYKKIISTTFQGAYSC